MNKIYWIISGGIVVLGFIYCFFIIWKSRRLKKLAVSKPEAIKHYEKVRDKLTFRENVENLVDKTPIPNVSLSNIIGGFVVILIGTALLPEISKQVTLAQNTTNVTGAANTLVGLTTLFFALAISASAIGIVAMALRNSGSV